MSSYVLTLEQLLSIENRLNSVKFRDSEIGGVLIDYFYCNSFFHSFEPNLLNSFITYASLFKDKFSFYHSEENQIWEPMANKIVLLPSANLAKNLEFFYPLINDESIDDFCFVGRNSFPINYRNTPFLGFTKISSADYKIWKEEYMKIKDKLDVLLKELANEFCFPSIFLKQLNRSIVHQTQILSYFVEVFKKNKPKLVLTDHDRMKFNSCVVMAANYYEIPTYTFIHGSTFPPDHYYPVLANRIFCWGEFHRNQFKDLGTPVSKLIVSGNQKLNLEINIDISNVLRKLQLNHKPIILLATNNITLKEKLLFAEEYCNACVTLNGKIQVLIRIHPSEIKEDYSNIIKKYNFVIVVDNKDLNSKESIAISSIIVCHNSQFGFDAFVSDSEVVVFDSLQVSYPLGMGAELAKLGCRIAKTSTELLSVLIELLDRKDKPNGKYRRFEYLCSATGTEATLNVLSEILKKI